jgi:hypothetical protein
MAAHCLKSDENWFRFVKLPIIRYIDISLANAFVFGVAITLDLQEALLFARDWRKTTKIG